MANIRVDVNYAIKDGSEIVFRSPVDCSQITGLIVYYPRGDGNTTSKVFALADAHGNNVGDIDHLFAENVVVKVILDVSSGMAYVQNADTNAYIERTFVKTVNGVAPDENGNVQIEVGSGSGGLDSKASALLITILRNGVYGTDQSANITALEAALASGGSGGEEGPDIPVVPDEPDEPDEPDGPVVTTYTITNTLSGVSNSNAATTVSEGGTYTATIAADSTHVLPDVDMGGSIVITMGGSDITTSVYDYNTGAVSIAPVTGNIVITVNAAVKPAIIEDGLQDFFDYRNAVVNASGDIESVIGDGIIMNVGTTEITADGFLLNHNYDATGTRTDYKDYDGTNHEWTAVFCYLMGSTGTYSVPFPGDEVSRSGQNHHPNGNYYNTAGTEVSISYNTAVKNNTAGAKLIGIIRNGATERAFYVAKQKNSAVEQVAIFNAADYSDFAYFSPLSYRHRPVSRTLDKSMMTAIYNRALTDEEIAEVVRYFKMEVA